MSGVTQMVAKKLKSKMAGAIKATQTETETSVKDFFFYPDIVYTMPGMKDEMITWINGTKTKLRKYYLTVFLREAHALFKGHHLNICFSKFCSLRPRNALLLKSSPADQCRCRIHKNFIMRLQGLKIAYDSTLFWDSILCDVSLNSKCWQNMCDDCADGANVTSELDLSKHVL